MCPVQSELGWGSISTGPPQRTSNSVPGKKVLGHFSKLLARPLARDVSAPRTGELPESASCIVQVTAWAPLNSVSLPSHSTMSEPANGHVPMFLSTLFLILEREMPPAQAPVPQEGMHLSNFKPPPFSC